MGDARIELDHVDIAGPSRFFNFTDNLRFFYGYIDWFFTLKMDFKKSVKIYFQDNKSILKMDF